MPSHRNDVTRTLMRRTVRQQPDEKPYLVGLSGEHAGRVFALEGREELVLGRTEDCEIRITLDEMVSRRHARLFATAGDWEVEDLESLNGTRVNGRDAAHMVLRRGDKIELGEYTTFKYDFLTEQERAQLESGLIDGLTEVWNRKAFDVRLPEMFRQAAERGRPLSLLMVDVDHFKSINDTFGHQAGDHALQEVAAAVVGWLEAQDREALCCRYGGEEFAVLLPRCPPEQLLPTAEGLRTAIAALDLQLAGRRHKITASVGGATAEAGTHADHAALVRSADENLYAAKAAGRNRSVCG